MLTRLWHVLSGRRGRLRRSNGLDAPILRWTAKDCLSVRQLFEGVLVLGGTGAGKTSTTGGELAVAMLRRGFGGLVLVAKEADGRSLWEEYCREAGREHDLCVFSPEGNFRFNPLDFELKRAGRGAGQCENVVNLLMTLIELADRGGGQNDRGAGAGGSDRYWKDAQRQLIRNAIEVLVQANGTVSVPELHRLILSAPQSLEERQSEAWRSSACCQLLQQADARSTHPSRRADLALAMDYFMVEYPQLASRTRSIVLSGVTSLTDVLNRGALRDLFGGTTNISPAETENAKIILVDLPSKEFGEIGTIANVLMKYCWQRSVERRTIHADTRPVFLFADEAQNFLTSHDMHFLATCRSAQVATVFLSQNVSNFYAAFGSGDAGRAHADSIFANLTTKIFHCNGDSVTNEWAANLIGKTRQYFLNASSSQEHDLLHSVAGLGESPRCNAGMSEQMDFECPPSTFTRLRTGGVANHRIVDALVFRAGQPFASTGRNWLQVAFQQRR